MLTLLASIAFAQTCDGQSYSTDPADFAALALEDFQDADTATFSTGHTEQSPYVYNDLAVWDMFWPVDGWCIPGMDSSPPCGGDNVYLANGFQTWVGTAQPVTALGFDWGTQGQSVDITVSISDGSSLVYPLSGQTGFFGFCLSDGRTITSIMLESPDGGIDNVRYGDFDTEPTLVVSTPFAFVAGGARPVRVQGADPGETVRLAMSPQLEQGPCPPSLGGACIDLANPFLVGSATVDPSGEAWFLPALPLSASGFMHLQAIVVRPGGALVSAPVGISVH